MTRLAPPCRKSNSNAVLSETSPSGDRWLEKFGNKSLGFKFRPKPDAFPYAQAQANNRVDLPQPLAPARTQTG